MDIKEIKRAARHKRVRRKVFGTTQRPRLMVHRSNQNMLAQIIDDDQHKVLLTASTQMKDIKVSQKYGGNKKAAEALGTRLAAMAVKNGIKSVSFDRGGYIYHGRIKSFAEAARKGGLEF